MAAPPTPAGPRRAPAAAGESERVAWGWLVALALAVAAVQQVLQRPWMGPDEPWHFEYAEHVAAGQRPAPVLQPDPERLARLSVSEVQVAARFPGLGDDAIRARQRAILASLDREGFWSRVDWAEDPGGAHSFDAVHPGITAARQPPLYPLLLGNWLRLCPAEDPALRLRFARLPSAVAFVLVVLSAAYVGRAVGGARVAHSAALFAALLPVHVRQSATVNNDVLATVLGAAAAVAAVAIAGGRSRAWAGLLLAVVAAPWAKSTALPVVGLCLGGALLAAGRAHLRARLRFDRRFALAAVLVALGGISAAVVLRESPILPRDWTVLLERVLAGLAPQAWHELARTALGTSNWGSRSLPPWFAWTVAAAAVPCTAAALWTLRQGDSALRRSLRRACALACLVQLAAVIARGAPAARYLLPALPPAAAWLAASLRCRTPWIGLPQARAGASPIAAGRGAGGVDLAAATLMWTWYLLATVGGTGIEEHLGVGQ